MWDCLEFVEFAKKFMWIDITCALSSNQHEVLKVLKCILLLSSAYIAGSANSMPARTSVYKEELFLLVANSES